MSVKFTSSQLQVHSLLTITALHQRHYGTSDFIPGKSTYFQFLFNLFFQRLLQVIPGRTDTQRSHKEPLGIDGEIFPFGSPSCHQINTVKALKKE